MENTCINPTGELPAPAAGASGRGSRLPSWTAIRPRRRIERDWQATFPQMKGQFLIDRDGVVRWAYIECGKEGLAGIGKFPSHDELVTAASRVITAAR